MNQQEKWYIGVDKLFDYVKGHPNHKLAEQSFDAVNRLQTLYSELSAGVHGRTIRDLESRIALRNLTFNLAEARKELKLAQRCTEAANFILAIENRTEMRRFSSEDRGIILGTLPRPARLIWHDFAGVIDRG